MNLPKLVSVPASLFWQIKTHSTAAIFSALLFTIAIFHNFGSDYYSGKWTGFGIAFLFITTICIYNKFGAAAAVLIGYLLASCIWMTIYAHNRYASLHPYELQALKYFSMESAIKLYMILLPLLAIPITLEALERFGSALTSLFVFISLGQIFHEAGLHGCSPTNSCGGALGNPSMNAGMMAVCLPIIFKRFTNPYRWIILMAVAAGVLIGKSNAGLGLVAAFLLLHLVASGRWRVLALLPVVGFCGWYFLGGKFMSSGDRLMMWEFFMRKWAANPSHWLFGTGFGTFGIFSRHLQEHFLVREGAWWIWMHNDWLQGLFETGVVGLILMVWLYTAALLGLWKRRLIHEAQSLVLFGLFMGMNFPLHISLCCAFVGWLLAMALYNAPHVLHNKPETNNGEIA